MARNLRTESEFGLPSPMPILDADGTVAEGADIDAAVARGGLPAFTDADAIAAGAAGQESGPMSIQQLSHEARAIYAQGDGTLGRQEPLAGTS